MIGEWPVASDRVALACRFAADRKGAVHHIEAVPILSDDLVRLDAHRESDIAAHVAGEDDETARRFGWWPQRSSAQTVRRAYEDWAQEWLTHGDRRTFAMRDVHDLRLLGGCELRLQPDSCGQVSYWTHAAERHRGYAARALHLLVTYARDLGLSRLESEVAVDNAASRRVSESAGFIAVDEITDEAGEPAVRYLLALKPPT
jgi:RimJ/RimL family protein N-acetyltransferase